MSSLGQAAKAKEQWRKRRIAWLARHQGLTWREVGEQAGVKADRAPSLFEGFEAHLASALGLSHRFNRQYPEEGVIIGELYPFKEETREQAKHRLAAIVRQSYLRLSPGDCEDCEVRAGHRVTCPDCKSKVCLHCWDRTHGFAVESAEAISEVDQEWNDSRAVMERRWRNR